MTLFAPGDPRPIHFMGIAGAGMSALAVLVKHLGVVVTGCDIDPAGAADLAAAGVPVWRGHDPAHVDGARAIVVTAAVAGEHKELERARWLPGHRLGRSRPRRRLGRLRGAARCRSAGAPGVARGSLASRPDDGALGHR
jgi:hypothetical protein